MSALRPAHSAQSPGVWHRYGGALGLLASALWPQNLNNLQPRCYRGLGEHVPAPKCSSRPRGTLMSPNPCSNFTLGWENGGRGRQLGVLRGPARGETEAGEGRRWLGGGAEFASGAPRTELVARFIPHHVGLCPPPPSPSLLQPPCPGADLMGSNGNKNEAILMGFRLF